MLVTYIITRIPKHSLTLKYQLNINTWLLLQSWFPWVGSLIPWLMLFIFTMHSPIYQTNNGIDIPTKSLSLHVETSTPDSQAQSLHEKEWLTTSTSSAIACSLDAGFFLPRPSWGLYVLAWCNMNSNINVTHTRRQWEISHLLQHKLETFLFFYKIVFASKRLWCRYPNTRTRGDLAGNMNSRRCQHI